MVLSSFERADLVRRVERALARDPAHPWVHPQRIRDAVDRTLGALAARERPHAPPPASPVDEVTAIVSAASTPDLASRLRGALASRGVTPLAWASATEGRHTVVTLTLPAPGADAVREAAGTIGARCVIRGGER